MHARTVCIIVGFTVALSVPASALDDSRPMKGSLEGYDEYGDVCGEGQGILLTSIASGTLTHLGLTKMVSPVCLGSDYSVIGTWRFTLTAANGDEVHGVITDWVFTDYGFDLFATITGGTGRFADAEGELTFPTLSTGSGIWSSELEGWISY